MNLINLIQYYENKGFSKQLASAKVCQDIILMAISRSSLNRNITIKGGIVMSNITNNIRRATRDIDLDFIHYSIDNESIKNFIQKLNCLDGIDIYIEGEIEELKHQDYHGKSIKIKISDQFNTLVLCKMDIGVHKHFDIEQDEYCFDVCCNDTSVSLLKNNVEQVFAEKLRSLLIFGSYSRRYKDIYDLYYLKEIIDINKLRKIIKILIFDDIKMKETTYEDIITRLKSTFSNNQFLINISNSRQRWLDEDIHLIAQGIIEFFKKMNQ